jgi:YVTN family beta-propeller protein
VNKEIPVGAEPHGCALNEDGDRLLVANLTEGTVSIIDTASDTVHDTVDVGGRPMALAVKDDRVFVTQFFARPIDGGPGPGFDTGSEGVVQTFTLDNPHHVTEITLSPLEDSGFTANRTPFCKATNPLAVNDTFCPDPTGANLQLIQNTPQGVYPNQLGSALICDDKLYLPNIGAQPEPPVQFRVNVQALVHVVDVNTLQERTDLHVNLNAQIATEPNPSNPFTQFGKLFGNDIVAIDADEDCENFFIVSRGGNYVLKATLFNGRLDIGAPSTVVRFQTGNIPTGIAVDRQGCRPSTWRSIQSSPVTSPPAPRRSPGASPTPSSRVS